MNTKRFSALMRPVSLFRGAAAGLFAFVLVGQGLGQSANPAVSCESLAKTELADGVITSVQSVAAGDYRLPVKMPPGGPNAAGAAAPARPRRNMGPYNPPADGKNHVAFCRVFATLNPSADSDIKVEVWLPISAWNRKLVGVGDFGWAGSIMYDGMLEAVDKGYTAVGTDTGHDENGPMGSFALGHPDKMIDYGYRAVHEMTLKAKALIKAYYGTAPVHSYWNGCSLGGQQGLTEVERFPQDFDGVIIGAPAAPIVNLNAAQMMAAVLINQDPERAIPPAKLKVVHQAVLNKCDLLDGVKDGILEDPDACPFDPQELQCKSGYGADCLTAPQVFALQQYYNGYTNPRTGKPVHAGTARGTEGGGMGLSAANPMGVATALFKYMIFQDANWDWKTFDIGRDVDFGNRVLYTVNPTTNYNFKSFFDRGGKLIMYHGWEDGQSPRQTFNVYESVLKEVGPQAEDSMRVFGIAGMGHCSGGEGCDTFDKLALIDSWMEAGKVPQRFDSAKLDDDGKVIRTHPACAYPMLAKYRGSGSTDDAKNYDCAKP